MRGHLAWNTWLAVLWCLLLEQFTPAAFLIGFVVGAATLFTVRKLIGTVDVFYKPLVIVRLTVVFVYELIVANLQVAWLIVRPRMQLKPAMIVVPLQLKSDVLIVALANMISLTPGTLTVDVAPDRQSLIVHCLNAPDVEQVKRKIKQRFEGQLSKLEQ
jgi:multicomponent Na+:H+ antiporter subunit E